MLKDLIKFSFLFAAFLASSASAQTAPEFFDLGVRAYERGDFESAAADFSRAADDEPSASAFHNAGNAYAKLGKPGLARLNYERARYINPRSPETRANLSAIIAESGDNSGGAIADTLLGEVSSHEWIWILIVSFWGGIMCLFILPPFLKRARMARLCSVFFGLAFIYSLFGCVYWHKARNTAISVSPDALLRISPAANAPASHAIAEGKSAKIIRKNGNYILVEFPAKKYGWCDTALLEPVWPPKAVSAQKSPID